MSEPRGNVLPIYFVADESTSMRENVDDLNRGLEKLLDALHSESMAAAKVRFCVLGFSDDTLCHLPLTDLRQVETMPRLSTRGGTSYKSAFEDLRHRIPSDVASLKSDGYLVNRPAVFLLSDGYPTDPDPPGWEPALAALKDATFRERPNILAFGIGSADPQTIADVASRPEYAFQADEGTDTGAAIAKFCDALTQSVVTSGQALSEGRSELLVERPENFKIAVDLI